LGEGALPVKMPLILNQRKSGNDRNAKANEKKKI
jgi:hypothetical protein